MAVDIIVPIPPTDEQWRLHALDSLYTGQDGTGRAVPNVGDMAWDRLTGFWIVTVVNEDYTSELEPWSDPTSDLDTSVEDGLLGLSGGHQTEMFRCYINYDVVPARMGVDSSLVTHDSSVVSYAIFVGTDLSNEDAIISAWFNASGEFVSNKIPMELVSTDEYQNVTTKHPVIGYTTRDVTDGEKVVFVGYSATGGIVKVQPLIVMQTNYIPDYATAPKQVDSIGLECEFLSATDDRMLEVPNNVNLDGILMRGVVNYADGTSLRIAIDGNKFAILGLTNFNVMIPDATREIVLKYYFGEGETTSSLVVAPDGASIQQPYTVKAIQAEGAYNCKIFTFPRWISEAEGYTLEHYLYMIDRNAFYYITPYVQLGANSNPFYPTNYVAEQTLTFTVNLRSVNGRFSNYNHVQTEKIWLKNIGTTYAGNWAVKFTTEQPSWYGENLFATIAYVNTNLYNVKIDSGISDMAIWVDELLRKGLPVLNDQVETLDDLIPTHFRLTLAGVSTTYPITYWNTVFTVGTLLAEGSLVTIHFEKRLANGVTLQVGMAALPIHTLVNPPS